MSSAENLSPDQSDALNAAIEELSSYLKKWQISSESLTSDEAAKIADSSPDTIFSVIRDWSTPSDGPISRQGFWLSPGFDPECDDYYESQVNFEGQIGSPFTEIRFECSDCGATGSIDDEDCEPCEAEGEIVFNLVWDSTGSVKAERG